MKKLILFILLFMALPLYADTYINGVRTDVGGTTVIEGDVYGTYVNVRNTSGSAIAAGKFVYFTGASGQKNLIGLADNTDYEQSHAIGYVHTQIDNNSNGTIVTYGEVTNQNTAAWGFGDGSELYLGTSGDPLDAKPTDAIAVPLGYLTYSNAGAGIVFINCDHPIIDTRYDFKAFSAADGTPSVSGWNYYSLADTGTITDFDDALDGQIIYVKCDFAGVFDLTSSEITASNRTTDYTATVNDILIFKYSSGDDQWYAINMPDETTTTLSSSEFATAVTDELGSGYVPFFDISSIDVGTSSLADGSEYSMSTAGYAGYGYAMLGDGSEFAFFSFTSDGSVILGNTSTNVTTTNDSDGNFNIYDGGSGVVLENQIGTTETIFFDVKYFTP